MLSQAQMQCGASPIFRYIYIKQFCVQKMETAPDRFMDGKMLPQADRSNESDLWLAQCLAGCASLIFHILLTDKPICAHISTAEATVEELFTLLADKKGRHNGNKPALSSHHEGEHSNAGKSFN